MGINGGACTGCMSWHISERRRTTLGEVVLSFYHVGSQDQTQVTRLGGKLLYFQSHVVGPRITNFYK